jgi:AsmA-like protein
VQTTLLGVAIAFIVALLAALIGPFFIDWNQFRPQFEAEASKIIGAPVRVAGNLSARLLPAPSLGLRYVVVGRANDLGKVRAERLDVEFSLGDLMRGEWRANELTIAGAALDIGLDQQGQIDWPIANGKFNFGSLSIDRLNLNGRVALHDAASRQTLELNDIVFSGEVRSLVGSIRGDGRFSVDGARYGFNVSSGQTSNGNGTRVHLRIDPSERTPSADFDGVLGFEGRSPRFDGTIALAALPPKAKSGDAAPASWRIAAKVKANRDVAEFEQIDASYGNDERALKFAGLGEVRFGASPLLHMTLSARQLDADRFLSKGNEKDDAKDSTNDAAKASSIEPARLLPGLRSLIAALPRPPIATQVSFGSEQITLGGRPLQNLNAKLYSNAAAWAIDGLDFRAPGATQISFTSAGNLSGPSGDFRGVLDIDSSDPDVLMMWLQGRSDVGYRSQKPLRLHGNLSVAADGVALDALKAEIEGGVVEGRVALAKPAGGAGSHLEAALKAERLDLDAASAVVRSLAGPQADWPDEAQLSLDVGRAISSGQELRPFFAKFGYTPKAFLLDRLKFGQPDGVMLDGGGNFDRANSTGRLAIDASTASMGQLTGLIAPLAPSLAARLDALATAPGPVRTKFVLNLGGGKEQVADRIVARADVELDAPQLRGRSSLTATPPVAAIRGLDLESLRLSEIKMETRLTAQRGASLVALLGLDQAVAAGDSAVQFEGVANGVWGKPFRLNAKLWGAGMDADAQGTADPWTSQAGVNLRVRSVNLAPIFGLPPSDGALRNVRLFARASLAGNKLTLDDLDSVAAGSRLRGRLTLNLDDQRSVDGEIGLDALDLTSAFAFAIGAAGHDAAEPFTSGLVKGWRGRIAFQALGGPLPDGAELRPVSGTIRSDGQSLTLDAIKGRIGGGDVTATIDAKQDAAGISMNGRLELAGVDGAALHYRGLKMPAGRTSLQMTLSSQGRSVAALVGALSGSGTATLDSANLAGLDPRAFDVAIRASDSGQPTDDARLRQIVDPVLSAGSLPVASAQIPFSIRDGRLRVGATTLEATGARAIISGGYDFPADQVDIRASLASTAPTAPSGLPEIQLFTVGTPDALHRTLDVAALSSWLAVRTIDRETRRLDSIERGEPVPPEPGGPPSTASLPSPGLTPDLSPSEALLPRRPAPKPKVAVPRPPAVAPPPIVSQQVAPLPPPIDVKPAPGSTAVKPKPRPPMVLTPPIP